MIPVVLRSDWRPALTTIMQALANTIRDVSSVVDRVEPKMKNLQAI